jgi:hypothetical protein
MDGSLGTQVRAPRRVRNSLHAPRGEHALGGRCASTHRPARCGGRTVVRPPVRSMLRRHRWTCVAAPRPEPRPRFWNSVAMRRLWLRTRRPRDRFPDHSDVATGAAIAASAAVRRHRTRPRDSDDRPGRHLVPYRLDTPTTPQVSPQGRRFFGDGQNSRHRPATRNARHRQLRAKHWTRRCRRDLAAASPTVTVSTAHVHADARCLFSAEARPAWFGRSCRCPPKRAPVRPPPVRTVAGQASDIEVGFRRRDHVATFPTAQHAQQNPRKPASTRSRLERAETHLRRNRASTSCSTTSRRTSEHPFHRPDTTGVLPRRASNPRRCRHRRGSPHRSRTGLGIVRTTGHPTASGLPPEPTELRSPPTPRGVRPPVDLLQPLPATVESLASGPVERAPAVHIG